MIYKSPSELYEFRLCKRKHYFHRVMGINASNPSEAQAFGSIVHEFLELYHKGVSVDDLMSNIEIQSYLLSEREATLLKRMMVNYVKFEEHILTDPSLKSIVIPRPDEAEFLFEQELEDDTFAHLGVIIRGRPDFIYKKDGVITVGEHKTTSEPWPLWRFGVNNQVKLYHMMASRTFPGIPVRVLFNTLIKTPGTRTEDITRLFQRYELTNINVRDTTVMTEQVLRDMQEITCLPYSSDQYECQWCNYNTMCAQGDNILGIMEFHERFKWMNDIKIDGEEEAIE